MTKRPPLTKKQSIVLVWFAAAALVTLTGVAVAQQLHADGVLGIGIAMIVVPLAVWLGFLFVRFCWRVGDEIGGELRVATRPIPSPDQISSQLEEEWGRPLTVEEVNAVYQMLCSRKNEAALNAGMGIGALFLLQTAGHHRPAR